MQPTSLGVGNPDRSAAGRIQGQLLHLDQGRLYIHARVTITMSSSTDSGSKVAQQTFELNNNISTVDAIYAYAEKAQKAILNARQWKNDPHHFKHVKISAVALIKMVTHARSGGQYEIMGLMQGKIENETFIVMDAFALPVLGTETRVNAGSEGDEYSVQYQSISKEVGLACHP